MKMYTPIPILSSHHPPRYTTSLLILLSFILSLHRFTIAVCTAQSTTSHTFTPNPQWFGSQYVWITLIIIIAVIVIASFFNIGYQHMKTPLHDKVQQINELKAQNNNTKLCNNRGSFSKNTPYRSNDNNTNNNNNDMYDHEADDTSDYINNSMHSNTIHPHLPLDQDTCNEIIRFRWMCLSYSILPLFFLCSKPFDTILLQQYIEVYDWYGRITELQFITYYTTGVTVVLLFYGFLASYLSLSYHYGIWYYYIYNLIHIPVFAAIGYYGYMMCDQSICRVYNLTQSNQNYPSEGNGMIVVFCILLICTIILFCQLSNSMKIVGMNSIRVVSQERVKLDREER